MNSTSPARSLALLLALMSAIGPFSIDTYLPAFHAIGSDLAATPLQVQQTMTAFLLPFGVMTLWHGAISDAIGRRRVTLAGLVLFALASIFCIFATSLEVLLIGRALQGLSAGVGMVVGRAVIRDLFDGPQAVRLAATVGGMFAIAPAIAPVLGGWIFTAFGWRGIFTFLTLFSLTLAAACWRFLPESLPPEKRQSLHPLSLLRAYRAIFGTPEFVRLSLAAAFNMCGMFLYIMSAPTFLIDHLHVSPRGFAWLFLPAVGGMMIGFRIAGHMAARWRPRQMITISYGFMLVAAAGNVALNLAMPPQLPWAVIPLAVFNIGVFMSLSSLQLLSLDMFPERRGTASSCQSVIQSLFSTATAGLLAPLLWGSTLSLAWGMAGFAVASIAVFLSSNAWRHRTNRTSS